MIRDRKGVAVEEGDIITLSTGQTKYKIIKYRGTLGVYDNGEFVNLRDEIGKFQIVGP